MVQRSCLDDLLFIVVPESMYNYTTQWNSLLCKFNFVLFSFAPFVVSNMSNIVSDWYSILSTIVNAIMNIISLMLLYNCTMHVHEIIVYSIPAIERDVNHIYSVKGLA